MREAFGGTFILKLIMVFFVVYVTFMGVALQIAKLYRIKNGVINILEQNQYVMGDNDSIVLRKVDAYLEKIPYNLPNIKNLSDNCVNDAKKKNLKAVFHTGEKSGGFCIVRDPNGSSNSNEHYYKVSVYFAAEFPFLGVHIPLTISGETMTINSYN